MNVDRSHFAEAIELWTEWNAKINVVSRKDVDMLYEHHILHSLSILQYLVDNGHIGPDDGDAATFLDVGCGGGFPGIPLAIALPGAEFTLCDSIGKKIRVAQAVSEGIGLTNVRCVNARVETLTGRFDWVVSRAVTSLDNFYPWVRDKFDKGILYLKGGDVNDEISALCARCGVDPSKVTVWPVSNWLDDDYFAEKFVIHIRK